MSLKLINSKDHMQFGLLLHFHFVAFCCVAIFPLCMIICFVNIHHLVSAQCLIQLLNGIAGPRDVESLKTFVLNEAEKAGEARLEDEL